MTSVEICAGAGGQSLGLERACFDQNVLEEVAVPFIGRRHTTVDHMTYLT